MVYCVLLDASQAFDRVQYVKLFKLLLKNGICPVVARILAYLYTNQKLRVKYGNVKSDLFSVTNGVKQGGVLSPILYVIYMDVLFQKLKQSKLGCHIGNIFFGCLGYADDCTLLAPSITSTNLMLTIVSEYGKEYNVKFNASKTQLVLYGSKEYNDNIVFQGTILL